MRINLFFAFIISTFLCSRIIDTLSFFRPQKAYWIYTIPVVFLLLSIFYKKVGFLKKAVSQVFLALSISIPYIGFVFFILLCLYNYPPEGEFETKLISEVVTEKEIDAGKRLGKLLEEFDKKLDTSEQDLIRGFEINDSNESKIVEILNKTTEDRKEILEYISKNSIALFHTFDETRKYYFSSDGITYDEDNNNLAPLVLIFKMQLLEVDMLRIEQKQDKAVNEYILLWKKVVDVYRIKNTRFIDFLCFLAISDKLGDYYYDNQKVFESYNLTEVAKLKEDVIYNLDRAFEEGITIEYNRFKTRLENTKNIWPLMDKNRVLRKLDASYYAMAEYEKDLQELVSFEAPKDPRLLKASDFLKGFIGEGVYFLEYHSFNEFPVVAMIRKNELAVYFYAMDKNNYNDVPKDYFTGEKFSVSEFSDHIEITSHTNIKLDSPKKYIIIKK